MPGQCSCQPRVKPALGCLECGAACCAACAIHLESVTYCARCARELLEASTVRTSDPFTLY